MLGMGALALAQDEVQLQTAASDAPQVVIQTSSAAPPVPELEHGPTFGLSAGLATGVGPTLGIPIGSSVRVQLTLLPIVIPDVGAGGSAGLRLQQFLGKNPKTRLYLVEGVGVHGWSGGGLWAGGVGLGIETRKRADTGRSVWFDVSATALGAGEGLAAVLPLPQAGLAWVF